MRRFLAIVALAFRRGGRRVNSAHRATAAGDDMRKRRLLIG